MTAVREEDALHAMHRCGHVEALTLSEGPTMQVWVVVSQRSDAGECEPFKLERLEVEAFMALV
jgi:hypothetical protein